METDIRPKEVNQVEGKEKAEETGKRKGQR